METEVGTVEITLRPDLAPNHVRNFIALSMLGYYDGLVFERTVHAKPADHPEQEVDVLEGGCPLGTGDIGIGSLGYWLKPEYSQEKHDVGTVGAPRGGSRLGLLQVLYDFEQRPFPGRKLYYFRQSDQRFGRG